MREREVKSSPPTHLSITMFTCRAGCVCERERTRERERESVCVREREKEREREREREREGGREGGGESASAWKFGTRKQGRVHKWGFDTRNLIPGSNTRNLIRVKYPKSKYLKQIQIGRAHV